MQADAGHVRRGESEAKPDYGNVASAVFSSPPLASVGLSEEDALAQYGDIDVFTSSFRCGRFSDRIVRLQGMPQFLRSLNKSSTHFADARWSTGIFMKQLSVRKAT